MINAGDFKKGLTFEFNNQIWTIIDFQHVKPGKGAAFVRTKMRNLTTNVVLEKTWNPAEKIQEAMITTKKMIYSYSENNEYYFMDEEYNMVSIEKQKLENIISWIKENDEVDVKFYKDKIIDIQCQLFVILKVIRADQAVKGNTSTNTFKDVILETNATIKAPLFINEGDYLKIDTRTGEYVERVKKTK